MLNYSRTIIILIIALQSSLLAYEDKPSTSKKNCEQYIYSDVRHIPDVDDYVGAEIVLCIYAEDNRIIGAWNEYQGFYPAITDLTGFSIGKKIQLNGENEQGKVELTANVDGKRLVGKLVWYIGSNRQERKLNLKRQKSLLRLPE